MEGNPQASDAPVAAIVLAVLFGAAVAGLITYTEDDLTLLGRTIVTIAGASASGLAVFAMYRSAARSAAVTVMVISVLLGAVSFALLKDAAPRGVMGFSGGCQPFTVFAQNRWAPLGAAVRAAPQRDATKVGSYAPNELVTLDGWVRSRAAYPQNTPPWNSDVWFHLADNSGWVSYAAVRADPTSPDPGGFSDDGGRPVETAPECGGSIQS